MAKCPSCGFHNPSSRERCLRCNTLLVSQQVPDAGPVAETRPPRFQPQIAFNRAVYFLSNKLMRPLPTGLPHRWPWTAAFLGLFFGAGQFYNHQRGKALAFALAQSAIIALFVVTIMEPWNNFVALLVVFWHLYAMADGFTTAARINGTPWRWRQLVAVWFALMFMLGGLLFLGQFFGRGIFFLTTVRSDSLAPVFVRGDKVFVLASPFAPQPRPGSVVYYNPGRYVIVRPGLGGMDEQIIVNERNSFGVVSAVEGEVMSWEPGGPLLINGNPAPPKRLPVNPEGLPGRMEFRVPDSSFGILMTHGGYEGGVFSMLSPVHGQQLPNPGEAMQSGYRIENYDEAVLIHEEDVHGIVLFRYYPPERRVWWGMAGGLWGEEEALPVSSD